MLIQVVLLVLFHYKQLNKKELSSVKCDSAVMFRFIISLVLVFKGIVVITSAQSCSRLATSSFIYCGDIDIKYPFWFDNNSYTDDLIHCGYPGFGIKCEEGKAVMNISNQRYRPTNFDFGGRLVRVKEMDIEGEECPHSSRNFSLQQFGSSLSFGNNFTLFYNCSDPPNNKDVEKYHLSCLDNSGRRSYAFPGEDYLAENGFNWYGNCEKNLVVPFSHYSDNYILDAERGFELRWSAPSTDCGDCEHSDGFCSYDKKGDFHKCSCAGSEYPFKDFDKTCPSKGQSAGVPPGAPPSNDPTPIPNRDKRGPSTGVKVIIGISIALGILLVALLLTYRRINSSCCLNNFRWTNIRSSKNVETFLKNCGNLALQRYTYSDIKKMTNSFKETLGKGGYGTVYKGKLNKHSGCFVAVKMLNESKGNGEDFINELATIGRTNHVNVVSLLGFCTEGTNRALVYEFMSNGSLERFIYNEKTSSTHLGWEKLYQIALGIARGLDYLHRGCNTRILHFDIKPHNILLNQEFCPKISDFGLAKICPTKQSVVSMYAARGTLGYIAPEFYRNFGGVSHKSDVYSYGMMVFEIIGGRKNIDATAANTSEIYFPEWIYNHLNQDSHVEESKEIFEEIFEDETTKKMIIVALWCIQTKPADRPSISKVVEMLEGNIENLQMPPNPFHDRPSRSSL